MVRKWQADAKATIYCKDCVMQSFEEEMKSGTAAAEKDSDAGEPVVCSACQRSVPRSGYSNSQLNTRVTDKNAQRCKECVVASLKDDRQTAVAGKQAKLKELRSKAEELDKAGNKLAALKAYSEAAALEAEMHSGVKAGSARPPFRRRR
ncbi:hypothetical protein DIPPA_07377 [Diplonema papillatum]|nr:hypothetical protein DIPPA_07377 [Diplonema papillatum]